MSWRETEVAADGTHHRIGEVALYPDRFDAVLKFHAPGLAPVRRGAEAWHIRVDGSPAYAQRFSQTFGFYEGAAAVADDDGWRHIRPDGAPSYAARFAWCGNFQGGRCPVRRADGRYLHITPTGEPAYDRTWRYAGDFRDGIGVVQRDDGRSSHIDRDGRLLHGRWLDDLDVFHKGLARARDTTGWMHVDLAGRPIYRRRFVAVEPFYNGQARVERLGGGVEVIDEAGQTIAEVRPALPDASLEASRLAGWGVGEVLHRGSHGAIYASGPDAVIKSSSNLGAWSREVLLLESLGGAGAPRLVDAFTRSGTGYIVMERIAGATLGRRNRTTPRSPARALAMIRDLAAIVGRVHEFGWIHGDLHPENVMECDGDGSMVLLDFANAVQADANGRWAGEVHWGRWELVPPEQFEGFTVLDRSVDTYALVGLLVYLVLGHGPFPVDVAGLRGQGWSAVREAFRGTRSAPETDGLPVGLRGVVACGLGGGAGTALRYGRGPLGGAGWICS
jgi:hypothetical protein